MDDALLEVVSPGWTRNRCRSRAEGLLLAAFGSDEALSARAFSLPSAMRVTIIRTSWRLLRLNSAGGSLRLVT